MASSPLRTALELKSYIDAIPKTQDPIGHVVNYIIEDEQYEPPAAGFSSSEDEGEEVVTTTNDLVSFMSKESKDEPADTESKKRQKTTASPPPEPKKVNRGRAENLLGFVRGSNVQYSGMLKDYRVERPPRESDDEGTAAVVVPEPIDLSITLKDDTRLTFTQETFTALYDKAAPSPFGDTKKLKTTYDDKVRASREYTDVRVSPSLQRAVERIWNRNMCPEAVAVPNKAVLYKKGDFFARHKDTPDKNLVGTVWVHLLVDKNADESVFLLHNAKRMSETVEVRAEKEWCAFYTDVEHEVPPLGGDYRVTMTFKLYAKNDAIPVITDADSARTRRILDTIKTWQRPFGLLLSHEYALDDDDQKGMDRLFVEAVKLLDDSIEYEIMAVLIKYANSWYPEEDGKPDAVDADVYRIDESGLNKKAKKAKKKSKKKKKPSKSKVVQPIPFVRLTKDGYEWKHVEEEGGMTGNESNPSNVNSIYVHRAVVVW